MKDTEFMQLLEQHQQDSEYLAKFQTRDAKEGTRKAFEATDKGVWNFQEPTFKGENYLLENTKFWTDKKGNKIEMMAWTCLYPTNCSCPWCKHPDKLPLYCICPNKPCPCECSGCNTSEG